jgi:hypothetical protein
MPVESGSKDFLESYRSTKSRAPNPPANKPPDKTPTPTIYPAVLTPTIAKPVQTLPDGEKFIIRIGSSEQRTYRIDGNRSDPPVHIIIITNNLTCVGEAADDGKPAFQLFNARGQAISKATPTCSDLFNGDVEPGDYYLVVKGAAATELLEVNLQAWSY